MTGMSTVKALSFNTVLRGGRITKWKGRVASLSPHLGALAAGVSVTAFATALLLAPTDAQAGTCVADVMAPPGTFVCSGPAAAGDVTQTITSTPLTVTTIAGFGITTAAGDAIAITGIDGTTFTDNNASAISGAASGINAANFGLGSLTINTNGAVTGATGYGILAQNNGLGALSITSGGTVTGTTTGAGAGGAGIFATNSAAGTSLTISTAGATAGNEGIHAENNGAGALSITSTGSVTGTGTDLFSDGIFAVNNGTDLTISAANVTGYSSAIYAVNGGTGMLSVTSTGDLIGTGTNFGGLSASNSSYGTDLTITTNNTTGSRYGISAVNDGSGALSIMSTGTATGTNGNGISAYNSGFGTDLTVTANNTMGGYDGIDAVNYGTGALSVTSTGTATGTNFDGISAYNSGFGTDLTVTANNTMGGYSGIFATNLGTGALSITSTGTATGSTYGIQATNGISPYMRYRRGPAVAMSRGAASGAGGTGSLAAASGTTGLTITANNTMGGYSGIYANNYGAGALSITSTGTATGTNYEGIYAFNSIAGTDLTVTANNTMGGDEGIDAVNYGTGALSVTSTGTTTGGDYGIVATNSGTNLTISANDTIGGDSGIYARNFGTGALSVTSNGTATGTGDSGISARNDGTNLSISANNTMGGDSGIYARNFGTGALSVTSNGTATGSTYGIFAVNSAAGTDLTIVANNATGGSNGIYAANLGTGALTITSMGTATGTTDSESTGIGVFNSAAGTSLTVNANNTSGRGNGIYATNGGTGALTINSMGMATGTSYYGIGAINYAAGTDLTITANNTMGGNDGINADNKGTGTLTVTASGTVTGGTGAGISTQSVVGGAVAINLASTATVGTSAGGSGVAILDGVGNATVTIAGGARVNGSILLGDGSDTLTVAAGAILTGVTRLSGEAPIAPLAGVAGDIDTLNIGADFAGDLNDFEVINLDVGSGSFTLGSVISNVTSLTKSGTGTATLSGISAFTAPTMVTGGTLNVTGMIASSPVTVQTGGTLTGTGTVGAVMAQSGATVSPGSAAGAIGTLTVNGGLTLAAGSTLAIDVAPMSQDLVSVTGAAMLGGNLVITPSAAMGFGQSITILSGGSVTGTFASTMIAGPFGAAFAPMVVINGASVLLQLAPNSLVMLGGPGLRPNALAFATAFDAAVTGGFNPQAFMGLFTQGANLPAALNQFTGEIHSAERRVALEDTRIVREAVFDRLSGGLSAPAGSQSATRDDGERAITLWTQGVASTSKAQADSVGSRFTSDRTGFLFGADVATASGFTFGGLFSSINSDVDLARLDKSKVRSVGGALYAGYRQAGSGFAVGGGGAVADNRFKDRRSITVPGVVQSLTSRSGGTTYQIFGEISYDLASAEDTRIEPFVRAAYAKLDAGALTEAGGVAAVKAGKQGNDLTTTTVGVRGAYVLGKATLSGSAGYQHASGDRSAPTDLSVVGVTNPFRVRSVALDRNAAALEAQAGFRLAPGIALGVGYSGVIGSNNTDHSGRATLTFAW